MIRWLHLFVGIAGVLVFLGTGVYMRSNYDMETVESGQRMLLRSRHIYILLASLLNLALGIYYRPPLRSRWRQWLQSLGSLLVLAAPAMLVVTFFRDATRADLASPLPLRAVVATLSGTLLHAAAAIGRRSMRQNHCSERHRDPAVLRVGEP